MCGRENSIGKWTEGGSSWVRLINEFDAYSFLLDVLDDSIAPYNVSDAINPS